MSQPGVSTPIAESLSPRDPPNDRTGEAGALMTAVLAVQSTLRELVERASLFDAGVLADVKMTLTDVERRLARQELQVVVVGERHSGKSTLLDAVVGDRLLGGARGQMSVVTFLRRRELPSYRARFASGSLDDFSSRVPDKTTELALAVGSSKEALAEVERRCSSTRSGLRRAIEALEQAELEVQQARSGVAGARLLEGVAGSELRGAQDESSRLQRAISELELRIPAWARSAPPRWALWLRLVQALFVLFRRESWLRYRALIRERDALGTRMLTGRGLAEEAEQARKLAEAGLEPLGSYVEQARVQRREIEGALRSAEAERTRLQSELEELSSRREHHESERWRRFFSELRALAGRRDLVELSIDYPAKLLPEDVTIVDIPGMVSATDADWSLIHEQADGCILVSELDRAVSETAKQFLRQLREVVPHVLLVLTKMDLAYRAAVRRGEQQPWEQVELARRIGTRRFARELGRDPASVLSISVAAEAALSARDSELATRFESELEKLFLLLRQERALILGARAASAIRRCIASVSEAEARAEDAFRKRIATLEQQRTPEPATFKQALLADAELGVAAGAEETIERAISALQSGFVPLQRLCQQTIDACPKRRDLRAVVDQLAEELSRRVAEVRCAAYLELEAGITRHVAAVEQRLFEAVRARYQILHEIRRTADSSPRLGAPNDDPPSFAQIAPQVRARLAAFDKSRLALGASGSLAGAASGALVHPWLGTSIGALLGGLMALARRESKLQGSVLELFVAALAARQDDYVAALRAEAAAVTAASRLALDRSLERALVRFGRWIAEPIAAERQAIAAERSKLAELEQLRDEISERDRKLERVLNAAAGASAGLCH